MIMTPVTSSQIAEVGYENGTLAVKFKGGATYTYAGVPQATFDEMLKAKSVGTFFGKTIRGKFEYKKVGA